MDHFLLAFIPMFFAVDPIGLLPIFTSLTQDLSPPEKRKIIIQSLATALGVTFGFVIFGRIIFQLLGITIGDFMIAGGLILFWLAMNDILQAGKYRRKTVSDLGVVPIGTPLIAGPAVLTMALVMIAAHGLWTASLALAVNIAFVAVVFFNADTLMRVLGTAGSRALSKVMSLLLAAIGVMMVRKGIVEILIAFSSVHG